jgi:drug/metabolite transporter (DMT)-like permease
MNNPTMLFAITTAIWGSTWLAITFQLGVVEPQVSVVYRFALAAGILFAWCRASGQKLGFPLRTQAWLAAQGATLFGLNYVGIYIAERYVASGLVAVAFSTFVFMVPVGARLAFGAAVSPRILIGAVLGVAGVALLFFPELRGAAEESNTSLGIAYALGSTAIAAIGNLITLRLQRDSVPTVSGTAWGMSYGALTAALVCVVDKSTWVFEWTTAYLASLVYLALVGSIIAFGAYFRLVELVGAGRASFTAISTPVVAMVLSTAFEGYRWTATAAMGAALAVAGNYLALRGSRQR